MTYEMCVLTPAAELERAVETAKRLGWSGLCLLADSREMKAVKEAIKAMKEPIKQNKSKAARNGKAGKPKTISVSAGLLIEPKSRNDLKRQVSASRKGFEIIAVKPKTPELSRAAVETKGIDVLLGWESVGQTAHERVMDYVMVKLAAESKVAIAFSMQPLLAAYDRARAAIMAKYLEAARFVKKYKTPFLLTSGAVSAWDLRSPSELAAFGRVLGFNGRDAKNALSGRMLEENRKRLSGKWVMPGIEVE